MKLWDPGIGPGRIASRAIAELSRPLSPRRRYQLFASVALAADRLSPDDSPFRSKRGALALRYLLFEGVRRRLPVELGLRVTGLEAIESLRDRFGGVLLCVVHLPLDPAIRTIFAAKKWPCAGITKLEGAARGTFGSDLELEVIVPNRHAFLHAKRRLAEGVMVLASQDVKREEEGTLPLPNGRFLRTNLFSFAHRSGVPVACIASRLAHDGMIELELGGASDPSVDDDESARAALRFYRTFAANVRARETRGVSWKEPPAAAAARASG